MKETTCLQCGCRGFTNAFVYCVKCLDVAVHRYCLDVIPGNNEFIHWVCDECKDEVQNRKPMVDCGTRAEPVVKPIWMGSFHIWNKKLSMLDGVVAHISTRACQEAYEESSQFQPVLHLEMLPKSAVWPKSFEISEPSCDSIALFFFSSERSERDFDLFVDAMMHKELAMRAFIQNAELLVFTSKDLPSLYWRFQEKYYLWGVFRGKHRPAPNSHLCKEELGRHMMMHGVGGFKITETMKSCDARSLLDTLRKGVSLEDKTRTRIIDSWEQAKPVDDSRQKAECHFCGFVSSEGGISHLKAHLGGGDLKIHVPGCCKVPPEVKRIIAESVSGCAQNEKAQCIKNTQGKSRKRGRPLDDAWDHAIPMDDIRQGTKCKYCNFVSKRGGITRLRAHLGGGDPTMRINGCPNVSPDIKILMEKEMKKFMERPKIPFQGTAKASGRGRPLDDAWEHCIPLDNIRQGAKCKYCNFVSKRGGIARLKAHLGGGDPIIRIRGCLNVPAEVKKLMAEGIKKRMKTPNGQSVGGIYKDPKIYQPT
ncbi:uncharacterized protein [Henckelia pumila]|uniref:uncharacterized protein isoform X3 n=1 Tax=Henckelia pumila TaxID=405737 RepID=UPI003C6DF0F2